MPATDAHINASDANKKARADASWARWKELLSKQ
jgi:hypothetical protein